jgi:hypothetical protein
VFAMVHTRISLSCLMSRRAQIINAWAGWLFRGERGKLR